MPNLLIPLLFAFNGVLAASLDASSVLETHVTTVVVGPSGSSKQWHDARTSAVAVLNDFEKITSTVAKRDDSGRVICIQLGICLDVLHGIETTFKELTAQLAPTNSTFDPNDDDQSKFMQKAWCDDWAPKPNVQGTGPYYNSCIACLGDHDNPGIEFGISFSTLVANYCATMTPNFIKFLLALKDMLGQGPPVYEQVFTGPLSSAPEQYNQTGRPNPVANTSPFSYPPFGIATYTTKSTTSSPSSTPFSDSITVVTSDLLPPETSGSSLPPRSLTQTISTTAKPSTLPPLSAIPTLPASLLSRIPNLGQWPYSSYAIARRPGMTSTYAFKDPDDASGAMMTVVVPLKWYPRPLGKQKVLLGVHGSGEGEGSGKSGGGNGNGSTGTSTPTSGPQTRSGAVPATATDSASSSPSSNTGATSTPPAAPADTMSFSIFSSTKSVTSFNIHSDDPSTSTALSPSSRSLPSLGFISSLRPSPDPSGGMNVFVERRGE